MPSRVLAIANRGEIAVRIARTARRCGWAPVVLLGETDWGSYAAREIGDVVRLRAGEEFDVDAVVRAANRAGATALHPGYGFLSERPELPRACAAAGITFVGPSSETLEICGDKLRTREIADELGIPVAAGGEALDSNDVNGWRRAADEIGYPVIAKIAGAGGGRGLRVARSADEIESAVRSALGEAGASGADATVFLEHYVEYARHVEVQVIGDGDRAVALGDRDCSLQRRYQKVVEEAPAPALSPDVQEHLHDAARMIAERVRLRSLATVEFLLGSDGSFYLMEINPRIQVEHTVTEEVTGLDLVEAQLALVNGGQLPEPVQPQGHAIQARLYAEDPFNQFLPGPGRIEILDFPYDAGEDARLRIDTGYEAGDTVPDAFDPMIAKIIVQAGDRPAAVGALQDVLRRIRIAGVPTNRPWLLSAIANGSDFAAGNHDLTTAGTIEVDARLPDEPELAALASCVIESRSSGVSAWHSLGPYRMVEPARIVFHGDDPEPWQSTASVSDLDEDPSLAIHDRGNGSFELTTSEGRWLVVVGPRASSHTEHAAGDGLIRAPMPGRVLRVDAANGDRVREGETLLVLETMKIEVAIDAPFDGSVAEISVSAGDLVSGQQQLALVQRDDEAGA